MRTAKFLSLLSVAVACTVGCGRPAPQSVCVSHSGSTPVEVEVLVPSRIDTVQLGANGSKSFRPAIPLRLGDIDVCLNGMGELEVSNNSPDPIQVSYVNPNDERKSMRLEGNHVGFFGQASSVAIGDTKFSVGE